MYRVLLTICSLLLLFLVGRQEQAPTHSPATPVAMAGLCSGDCASCGCLPALAASGNCCCTRTRQLRRPELPPTIAVNATPSDGPHPLSLRCAPCDRAPAALPAIGGKLDVLAATTMTVASPSDLVRTIFPAILPPLGCGAAAPPSPPPEIVA
ncbi:MAG: hypothetical protein A2091_12370 [Desulfuromonadales bacterium GWD2_61_12]|nr:MAG: hypothetical protein A2005_10400 [Desulfuromonadales bacterium GWC2_61_20]OGR35856.1 MAG: hypothetical protein A2091_12370 [Desulfuromonadales bacterium GWD2_61_12]HBT82574.1 hypothetical protein [Desulfuromonas sp.]